MYVRNGEKKVKIAEKNRRCRGDCIPVTTTIDKKTREQLIDKGISFKNALAAGSNYLLNKEGALKTEVKELRSKTEKQTQTVGRLQARIYDFQNMITSLGEQIEEKKRINGTDFLNALNSKTKPQVKV